MPPETRLPDTRRLKNPNRSPYAIPYLFRTSTWSVDGGCHRTPAWCQAAASGPVPKNTANIKLRNVGQKASCHPMETAITNIDQWPAGVPCRPVWAAAAAAGALKAVWPPPTSLDSRTCCRTGRWTGGRSIRSAQLSSALERASCRRQPASDGVITGTWLPRLPPSPPPPPPLALLRHGTRCRDCRRECCSSRRAVLLVALCGIPASQPASQLADSFQTKLGWRHGAVTLEAPPPRILMGRRAILVPHMHRLA